MEYISPDIDYAAELGKINDELNDLMSIDENSAYDFMRTAYAEEIEELRDALSDEVSASLYLDSLISLSVPIPVSAGEYGKVLLNTFAELREKNRERIGDIERKLKEKERLLSGLTKKEAYATLCADIEFYELRLQFLAERLRKIQREND